MIALAYLFQYDTPSFFCSLFFFGVVATSTLSDYLTNRTLHSLVGLSSRSMLSLQAHQEIIYKNSDFISHYEVINVGFHETAINDVQVAFTYAIVTQFYFGSVRLAFE